MASENISVSMTRATLTDLPQFALPAPYTLRWYELGDEQAWVDIHVAADAYHTFTMATFEQEFGADRALLSTRQAYLCDEAGKPIGTTSAWFYNDEEGDPYGLVHWVAIHPTAQGKGLSKPLLGLVCERLRALGHSQGYLNTSTGRIPAISLYLHFGFVPQMRRDRETTLRAWRQVSERLQHPAVEEFLRQYA